MERDDKKSVDSIMSVVARLSLFVVDELEPVSAAVLEADLEELYAWLVAVERKANAWNRVMNPSQAD